MSKSVTLAHVRHIAVEIATRRTLDEGHLTSMMIPVAAATRLAFLQRSAVQPHERLRLSTLQGPKKIASMKPPYTFLQYDTEGFNGGPSISH